jgi:molybdenum cofactor guanylyltransferase
MGQDKAMLPFHGETLAQSVAVVVSRAAGNATLVGDPARYTGLGYPVIPDLYPGEGPLGGILTALSFSTVDWNLVVACDMPQLDAERLRALLETASQTSATVDQGPDAVLPIDPVGRPQPLCAVYHRRCLQPFKAIFASGVRKVMDALAEVRTMRLPVGDESLFLNVNTPQEWSKHAAG